MDMSTVLDEEVKYALFRNIDVLNFENSKFTPGENKYDVYIFEKVQDVSMSDVNISSTQFLSNGVKSFTLLRVNST